MTKTKTEKELKEATDVATAEVVENTEELDYSPFLYIFSQGCGWCKRSEPIVDELIKEGKEITKLDLADGENRQMADEVKKEYGVQCGTPLFINEETGKFICGFREKDILEKWLNGEDIPAPPRPKGPPPRPPFYGASEEEENKWKEDYEKWLEENDHLPDNQKRKAEEILAMPRPKSDPPSPPPPTAGDAEYEEWAKKYDVWYTENDHLPNRQTSAQILSRLKGRTNPGAPPQPTISTDNTKLNTLEAKINALEVKIDKVMNHFGVK